MDSCDGDWNSLLNNLFILYQLQNGEGSQAPAYVNHIHRLVIDPLKKNASGKKYCPLIERGTLGKKKKKTKKYKNFL